MMTYSVYRFAGFVTPKRERGIHKVLARPRFKLIKIKTGIGF